MNIGSARRASWLVCILMAVAASCPVRATEQGGLLVEISKSVVQRNDGPPKKRLGTMSVDRTMSIKVDVKNSSMKDMAATNVEYVALVERWSLREENKIERFQGSKPLEAIPVAHNATVLLGEFHIGGHMHGTSERHVDHLIGWKVVIERDGQKLEFTSGSNFDLLNAEAR